MNRVRRRVIPAALLAACVMTAAAEPPADPRADDQFRHALSLLLNARVPLHEEAAKEFAAFLQAYPGDPRVPLARFWLGESLLRADRLEDALKEFTAAADDAHAAGERHAEALFRVGELQHRLGRYDAAVAANGRFLARYPAHDLAAAVKTRDELSRLARLQEATGRGGDAALQRAREESARDDAVGQEALALLGTLLFDRNDFAGAAAAGDDYLRRFSKAENAEEIRFNAAAACLKIPDDKRALELLRGVTRHRADEAAYLRGAILLRLGREPEAQEEFRAVMENQPESPYWAHAVFERGRAGDQKARELLLTRRPGTEPADQTACLWAAELLQAGKPDEALKRLESVKAESPLHEQAQALRAGSLYQSGAAHEKKGAIDAALKAYEETVRNHPKDRHAPFALLRTGALLLDKNRKAAREALERIGRDYPAFEHAGQAAALLGHARYAEAFEHYEAGRFAEAAPLFAALADDPALGADAAYTAALCWRKLDKPAEQEALLRRLREKHPDFKHAAEVRRLLGDTLVEQKKWQEAATYYADWAAEEKASAPRAEAQLKAGMAFHQLNQIPRAKELLAAAAEQGEPFVKARATFTLGEIELARNNHEEAKRLFLKVSVLFEHPELTPASMLEAAKCMNKLGETDTARKLLQAVVKDYPDSAVSAAARTLLK